MEQQHTAVVRQLTRDLRSKSSERGLRELHFAVSSTEGCTLTCGRCYRCRGRRSVVFSFTHTSGLPTRNEQVKAVKGIANTRPAKMSRSKIAHSFLPGNTQRTDAEESDWTTTSVVSIGKLPPKQASPGPTLSVRLGRGGRRSRMESRYFEPCSRRCLSNKREGRRHVVVQSCYAPNHDKFLSSTKHYFIPQPANDCRIAASNYNTMQGTARFSHGRLPHAYRYHYTFLKSPFAKATDQSSSAPPPKHNRLLVCP